MERTLEGVTISCLFKNIELGGVALDYGCGVGRAIVRYSDLFERIDGVDISDRNIELARKYYSWSNIDNPIPPMLWVNNGVDLADVPCVRCSLFNPSVSSYSSA
jgi:ubiquinone/menaquinone biosynthesis C-methylase UbiE